MLQSQKTLAAIASKPGTTKRDCLTITRRVLRNICQAKDAIHAESRALNRQAGKLRQFLPFTAIAVADLEQQARDHRAEELAALRRVLVAYGQTIIRDRDGIAKALGVDQLADLLNINRIDRERARREGWRTLSELVAIHDLENSAERRGDRWGDGSPLYQACQLARMDFILECPPELLPDPFAPGAPFGPRLPPELRIV
ncbi:hypothetical protein [Pseudomonas sp. D(2018)]|uniref:hypothetical protein n=1 Tax=Pseudomonas sp. D(2018) TaxID=2502238 RepID=UPI0010F8913B|nr:hypothetical protein [Pseudomonas sp. D(2018)]